MEAVIESLHNGRPGQSDASCNVLKHSGQLGKEAKEESGICRDQMTVLN